MVHLCEYCKTENKTVLNENSSRACCVYISAHPILELEESASRLTSVLSLEAAAAPLPWPLVSLAGATLICCTGMLLFPSNAAALLPRLCQRAGPAHPLVRVPASVPLSRPPATPPPSPPLGKAAPTLLSFLPPKLPHLEAQQWNGIKSLWQQVFGGDGV